MIAIESCSMSVAWTLRVQARVILTHIREVDALHNIVLYTLVSFRPNRDKYARSRVNFSVASTLPPSRDKEAYRTTLFLHVGLPRRVDIHLDRVACNGEVYVSLWGWTSRWTFPALDRSLGDKAATSAGYVMSRA
jgi:hypothetical protein